MKKDMHFEEEFEIWLGEGQDRFLLTDYFYVQDVIGRELAEYEIESMTVPGREGSILRSKTLRAKPISIKAIMMYDTEEELREAYNELNGLLNSDQPGMMTFSDEPEFSYYVTFSGAEPGEQKRASQKITLNFFRADPYKYGLEQTRQFENNELQVINDGTGPARPMIEIRPTEPVTHVDVYNENTDEYMRIGEPPDVDATLVEPKTRIVTLGMHTLAGWIPGTTVDDGNVAGTMKTREGYFYTDDFGTGSRWHGPAEKYSLPSNVQDFLLDVDLRNIARNNDEIGRIEVALLDVDNNQVGKVMMTKFQQGSPRMYCVIQAGDSADNWKLINEYGEDEGTWTRFNGRLKLSREGNVWKAWVGWFDPIRKEYNRRRSGEWEDQMYSFTNPIAQVQVHIAQYGDKPVTRMESYTTIVERFNDIGDDTPYIADVGDVITLDHVTNDIRINDETIFDNPFHDMDKMKGFGAKFFPLQQGMNKLYTFPSGKFDTTLEYRKRFM